MLSTVPDVSEGKALGKDKGMQMRRWTKAEALQGQRSNQLTNCFYRVFVFIEHDQWTRTLQGYDTGHSWGIHANRY